MVSENIVDFNKGEFGFTFDIQKINKESDKRIIEGYASIEEIDRQGDVILLNAFSEALSEYMQNPVIRYMHREAVIGKTLEARVDSKGLFVRVEIVNSPNVPFANEAWDLIEGGFIKAFSIGGKIKKRVVDKATGVAKILELWLAEISVVDIPANRNSFFNVAKKLSLNEVNGLKEKDIEKQEDALKAKEEEEEEKEEEEEEEEDEEDEEEEEEKTPAEPKKSATDDFTVLKNDIEELKKRVFDFDEKKEQIVKAEVLKLFKQAAEQKKKALHVSKSEELTEEQKKKMIEDSTMGFIKGTGSQRFDVQL